MCIPHPLGTGAARSVQAYDDLGTAEAPRPPLGGDPELPYPRHLANSRPEGAQGPGKPWLMFGKEGRGGRPLRGVRSSDS